MAETSESMASSLDRLYRKLPRVPCRPACGLCCGLVPWSPVEFARVAERMPKGATTIEADGVIIPHTPGSTTCPFLSAERACTVYDDRPFMCRAFGTAREPRLRCPVGCQPTHPLGEREIEKITLQYIRLPRE